MTDTQQMISVLNQIHSVLLNNSSEYAMTDEALKIVGLKSKYDLTLLRNSFMKPGEYGKRGRYFVYKKEALKKLADKLDKGEIIL